MKYGSYKTFLFDLDGTVYRGKEPIPEAVAFVKELKARGLDYLFITNNSTRTADEVAIQLSSYGIPCSAADVLTTGMAAARFVAQEKPNASVFAIGEEGLIGQLSKAGLRFDDRQPDYVVFGMDRTINYQKYEKACFAVRAGAHFISTNPDVALPNERGLAPGNGALTAVIAVSTGVTPVYIGKPEPIMIEQALNVLGAEKATTVMIGDNYDTDIMAGIRAGLDTMLVLTGVTSEQALAGKPAQPTYVCHALSEWDLD
ncbi:MAG: TIGR01457 family HAD-type hydrolase [Sporolactobacillus sp.]